MSYQSYPSGGTEPGPGAPAGPAMRPPSIQNAVRLMYVGAALTLIETIVAAATVSSVKSQVLKSDQMKGTHLSAAQVSSIGTFIIISAVIGGIIGIALWLWMAYICGKGRSWGRIVSSVLFGIGTLDLLASIAEPKSVITLIFAVLVWLTGLGAIVFLWQRPSTQFFHASA